MAEEFTELSALERCGDLSDREWDQLYNRYMALDDEVSATWGNDRASELAGDAPACIRNKAVYVAAFRQALAEATLSMRRTTAAFASGAWLGPLRLCGIPAVIDLDRDFGPSRPALIFTLPPSQRNAFAGLTARMINRRIAVRFGGHVVYVPVYESIRSGGIKLSGPPPKQLEQMKAAISSPC